MGPNFQQLPQDPGRCAVMAVRKSDTGTSPEAERALTSGLTATGDGNGGGPGSLLRTLEPVPRPDFE